MSMHEQVIEGLETLLVPGVMRSLVKWKDRLWKSA